MVRPARLTALVAILSGLVLTRGAVAQEGDATRAEKLFDEGRDARDRGDHATACAKFGESASLVKRASTLINLAACEEKLGKLKAATEHGKEGLAMLPPGDDRLGPAKEVLDRAAQRAPRVSVKLPANAPAGLRVAVDGAPIDSGALAAPLTLDPGAHTFVLSAPGHADGTTRITLAEGQRADVALVLGAAGPASPTKTEPGASGADAGSARRTLGYVAGGVGLAGLVAAGVTGGVLLSNDGTIGDNCKDKRCNQKGLDAIDASKSLITVNYVAWGVGLVGVAAGAVLVLTSPGSGDKARTTGFSPWVSRAGGGVKVSRRF